MCDPLTVSGFRKNVVRYGGGREPVELKHDIAAPFVNRHDDDWTAVRGFWQADIYRLPLVTQLENIWHR
jgi:hypothetical protein